MAAHACLKNEFTEDEKCHNLMGWLSCQNHRSQRTFGTKTKRRKCETGTKVGIEAADAGPSSPSEMIGRKKI